VTGKTVPRMHPELRNFWDSADDAALVARPSAPVNISSFALFAGELLGCGDSGRTPRG
jgi:hypothetical protein